MDGFIKLKEKVEEKKQEAPEMELKTSLPLVKWEAPEYDYVQKSINWFWSVGIIGISLAIASILLGNILFAILIVLMGFTIILYGCRRPRKVLFSLTSRGVQIENRLFPYENLRSFWIHYDPPHKKLLTIELKKMFMPIVIIPLGDTDPNVIREHLLKFAKEKRREESITETLTRLLGF